MKKLDDKQHGPLKVIQKVRSSSYKLEIPQTWKCIHNVFNECLLTPYYEPEFPNQSKYTQPPLVVEGDEPEFEVEEIVDLKKVRGGAVQYKVKWKGYGHHEMTWEPALSMDNAKEEVKEFHRKYPNKP